MAATSFADPEDPDFESESDFGQDFDLGVDDVVPDEFIDPSRHESGNASATDGPPRPIVWAALRDDEAEYEWLRLNEWIEDLRVTFNLDATVIPPFWHRHPVLVEHLSALRTHWLAAFDPEQHASAPFGWIRDLAEWKIRMRQVVGELGCRIGSCRPQSHVAWPGEPEDNDDGHQPPEVNLADRYDDFVTYLWWDVARRRSIEARYYRMVTSQDSKSGLMDGGV
jgi:hypothetical protein